MMDKKSPPTHIRHPKAALKSAIATLEQFARKTEAEHILHATDLAVKEGQLVSIEPSPIKKVMRFIAAIFSRKAREEYKEHKESIQNAVQEAIDTVKKNYLILEKLKAGDSEEQQLAHSTFDIIRRYNKALEGHSKKTPDWSMKVAKFLYDQSGFSIEEDLKTSSIELPMPISSSIHEETEIHQFSTVPLLTQETDIIRMKANTLLKQHGIKFKSAAETVKSVKGASIHASLNPNSKMSTICLTLDVLPGTTIKVTGSFKRDCETTSAPISDSFSLSIQSMHTGFPFPAQCHGWSLSDVLMPYYPHRLEQLPLFKPLYEKKKKIAESLQPGGELLDKAKQLFRQKHQLFEQFRDTFLIKHEELCHAIVSAAASEQDMSDYTMIVSSFFHFIKEDVNSIPILLDAYNAMNANFLIAPYSKLKNAWIERSNPLLFHADPHVAFESAHQIPMNEIQIAMIKFNNGSIRDKFVQCIGKLIGGAGCSIMMQSWSETLECAPPLLNDFEQKIQAAVYTQLDTFCTEMDENFENGSMHTTEHLWQRMQDQLNSDISLFKTANFESLDGFSATVVRELEDYFNSRFLNKKNN